MSEDTSSVDAREDIALREYEASLNVPPQEVKVEGGVLSRSRIPRPIQMIAALAVMAITAGATATLAYDVIISGSEASLQILGTIATLGIGALIALAGVREGNKNGGG